MDCISSWKSVYGRLYSSTVDVTGMNLQMIYGFRLNKRLISAIKSQRGLGIFFRVGSILTVLMSGYLQY